jgi:hypothetical protein
VLSTRVQPIERDVVLSLTADLSPAGQSAAFAAVAKDMIAEGDETNRLILGRIPPRKTYVDGSQGVSLDSVKPGGVIVAEWELVTDVLIWIANDLIEHSPVGRIDANDRHPGLYKRSHTLFANAVEVPVGEQIPEADEYVFMNLTPYARKLEGGSSRQFDHIYEGGAKRARSRFGNIAKILFTYRGIVGGNQINPETVGAAKHQRNAHGRFTYQGGSRAHNVSDVRFPAITVRIG